MPLNLDSVSDQLESIGGKLKSQNLDIKNRLDQTVELYASSSSKVINSKRANGKITWLVPSIPGNLTDKYPPAPTPANYLAIAVDGSHIDVDRHLPIRCALINISKVSLKYGVNPDATLDSHPRLYASPNDMTIKDPTGIREYPIEGPLLGIKRSMDELVALADLAEEIDEGIPTIALIDGSLIPWGLAGQAYPEYVRQSIIVEGLLPAFSRLKEIAKKRPLAIAAYVSLPRSTEVINSLRISICPYDPINCDTNCGHLSPSQRPCDIVDGIMDRNLFASQLDIGERSALFKSNSSIVTEYYGEHEVAYYYLNAGEEIARVEVPGWVSQDEMLLSLSHSLVLDQCKKGMGYPTAIMEAHEQAVIGGPQRDTFYKMVEEQLAEHNLPVYTSDKARSKRLRWL